MSSQKLYGNCVCGNCHTEVGSKYPFKYTPPMIWPICLCFIPGVHSISSSCVRLNILHGIMTTLDGKYWWKTSEFPYNEEGLEVSSDILLGLYCETYRGVMEILI